MSHAVRRSSGFEGWALEQLYWNEWDPQSRVLLGGAERAGSARRPAGDDEAVADLSAALEAQLQEYIALPQRYLGDRAEGAAAGAGPAVAVTAEEAPPRPSAYTLPRAPGAEEGGEEGEGREGEAPAAAAVEKVQALYEECIRQPGEFHVQEETERLLERSRALILGAGLRL